MPCDTSWMNAFRSPAGAAALVRDIRRRTENRAPLRIMEICGTHTMAIAKSGLRSLLAPGVELISGPGCPVCVTPAGDIDAALDLCGRSDLIVATYGDLLRVPGVRAEIPCCTAGPPEQMFAPYTPPPMPLIWPDQIPTGKWYFWA